MSRLFISGLTNIETTLAIAGFPLPYAPVHYPFHGIHSSVSGVAVNLALALQALGHDIALHSLIGPDLAGARVKQSLQQAGLALDGLHPGPAPRHKASSSTIRTRRWRRHPSTSRSAKSAPCLTAHWPVAPQRHGAVMQY